MNTCPYCGSDLVELLGMDDGGGDYGEAVCETWDCHDCGQQFEGDCIGQAIDGNFFDQDDQDDQDDQERFIPDYNGGGWNGDQTDIPY